MVASLRLVGDEIVVNTHLRDSVRRYYTDAALLAKWPERVNVGGVLIYREEQVGVARGQLDLDLVLLVLGVVVGVN